MILPTWAYLPWAGADLHMTVVNDFHLLKSSLLDSTIYPSFCGMLSQSDQSQRGSKIPFVSCVGF
jgi:hypothetical protein